MLCGGSAIRRSSVERGSSPAATTARDERLAGDHPDQAAVVADEERPHLGAAQSLPRLLRARAAVEHRGIRDHRVAHAVAHG